MELMEKNTTADFVMQSTNHPKACVKHGGEAGAIRFYLQISDSPHCCHTIFILFRFHFMSHSRSPEERRLSFPRYDNQTKSETEIFYLHNHQSQDGISKGTLVSPQHHWLTEITQFLMLGCESLAHTPAECLFCLTNQTNKKSIISFGVYDTNQPNISVLWLGWKHFSFFF